MILGAEWENVRAGNVSWLGWAGLSWVIGRYRYLRWFIYIDVADAATVAVYLLSEQ